MEMVSVQFEKSKMADLINFVSKRVIDAKKEEKRKAREQILKKASVIDPCDFLEPLPETYHVIHYLIPS